MPSFTELLRDAQYQMNHPREQHRAEDLVRRLTALAQMKDETGDREMADELLAVADGVNLVNSFATLPQEVLDNYKVAFDPQSAHAQSTHAQGTRSRPTNACVVAMNVCTHSEDVERIPNPAPLSSRAATLG